MKTQANSQQPDYQSKPFQRKSVFTSVARGLEELKAKLASADVKALQATIAEQKTQLDTNTATIADLEAQLAAAQSNGGANPALVKELETAKTTIAQLSSHSQSLSQATLDQVAALGFDAAKLPGTIAEGADSSAPSSPADFIAKLGELSSKDSKAAGEYYAAHAAKFGYEVK